MAHITEIGGVDPGLVDTGLVDLLFDERAREVVVTHLVVQGDDVKAAKKFFATASDIFIEGYRPRSNLTTDKRMVESVSAYRTGLKGTVLLNTGVKKVVRRPLMELLGVWTFATSTHHQDLRSAARIALLGMLKDDSLNRLLTTIVSDMDQGLPWAVHH
jgi:hypothetical protein